MGPNFEHTMNRLSFIGRGKVLQGVKLCLVFAYKTFISVSVSVKSDCFEIIYIILLFILFYVKLNNNLVCYF